MHPFSYIRGLQQVLHETQGDPRVRVAILDGTIDRSHPSLVDANLSIERPHLNRSRSWRATNHGTHVASIILGRSDREIRGLAPEVSGTILPILDENEAGVPGVCDQQTLAAGILAALDRECSLVNISAGAQSCAEHAEHSLARAIEKCAERGVLVVVATGNQGCECAQVPAAFPQVLAVGAMDEDGKPLRSSNWGPAYRGHGIIAPGRRIPGARKGGGTAYGDGTSYAAAIVTGIAALLLSLQLKEHLSLDPARIRNALLRTASKAPADDDRVLGGRLNLEGALRDLRAASRSARRPSARALREVYQGISANKFGTTDVVLPTGGVSNVPDLHYPLPDGSFGLRIIPVRETGGPEMSGSWFIDAFLRREMGIGPDAPIFALVSFTQPDEHRVSIPDLFKTRKLRLGHQHLAVYIGGGLTTHSLPATRIDEWRRKGHHFAWNVKGRPANVHILSLYGTPQEVLNRNARIADLILTAGARSPLNTESTQCRTVDLNTVLQYYRDWIRDADYLSDLAWYMNCANHKTVVVNIAVNLPHNPGAFEQIFGTDGENLWQEFLLRYERAAGRTFESADQTDFTALWALEGLDASEIRPLSVREYNGYRAAEAEHRLDQYRGPVPLPPNRALAWPLETVADVLLGVVETYAGFVEAGGVACALAWLSTAPVLANLLRLSSAELQSLSDSVGSKLLLAEALVEAGRDLLWIRKVRARLYAGLGGDARDLEIGGSPDRTLLTSVQRLLSRAEEELPRIRVSGGIDRRAAAAWLHETVAPDLESARSFALRPESGSGMFSTPGIVARIARGKYSKSRFIQFRTVCTAMDESELDMNIPSDFTLRRHQITPEVTFMSEYTVPVGMSAEPGDAAINAASEVASGQAIPGAAASPSPAGGAASCGCSCRSATPRQLVYALGTLSYDFPSQSRRDSLKQKMADAAKPENPEDLLAHLDQHPWDAAAVQWTLSIENTPIYVLEPQGPFAREAYDLLRRYVRDQLRENVDRVSVAGVIEGTATLRSGLTVPVLSPEIRGMYNWTTDALITALAQGSGEKKKEAAEKWRQGVRGFLERVYYELRNPGLTSAERALNFAATNALEVARVYESAISEEMELDSVQVEHSPISPPGADCWDVKLSFFYPARQVQTVRKVYRIAVDVTDVVPVTVGAVRSWFVR